MEFDKTIKQLRLMKEKLQQAIAALEDLMESQNTVGRAAMKRRGRKGMGPEERLEVSKRMKQYWAKRRKLRSK